MNDILSTLLYDYNVHILHFVNARLYLSKSKIKLTGNPYPSELLIRNLVQLTKCTSTQKEVEQLKYENDTKDETKKENKKIEFEEKFPEIKAYELPFGDKTVEKYDAPKNSKFFFTYEYLCYEDNKWHMFIRPVDNPYEKVEIFLKSEHVLPFFEEDEDVTFEDIKKAYSN